MAKKRITKSTDTPKKATPKKTTPIKTAPKKAAPIDLDEHHANVDKEVVKELSKRTTKKQAPKKEAPPKVEPVKNVPVADRVGPAKTKRMSEDKYIRLAADSDIEKFKEMSQRIQNGSIQWAYYAVDGEKGYHYYLVLKK